MNLTFIYQGKMFSNFDKVAALSAGVPLSVWEEQHLTYIQKTKLTEFNTAAEREISALVATYPPSEITSFSKQETEARAWIADNTAVTPLLDALAEARGIDKAVLVDKVVAKSDAFAAASGAIIGKRQKLEDRLNELAAAGADETQYQALTW